MDVTNNLFRKSDDGVVLERLLSLEALVSSLTAFEARSPHDTIYAILWLAHDAEPDSKDYAAMSQDAVMRTPAQSPDVDATPSPSPEPDNEMGTLHLGDDFVRSPANTIPRTSFPGIDRRSLSPSRIEIHSSMPKRETWLNPPKEHARALSGRSVVDRSLKRAEKNFDEDPEPIIVDYKKEVFEVCQQFLEFAITRSKSLDIICHPWAPDPPTTESSLPSWITRVSNAPFARRSDQNTYARVHADPLVGAPGNGPRSYNACGKTKPYPSQQFIIGRTLLVTGFVLDTIKVKQSPATRGIIPCDWLELARWSGSPEPVPDKFWRTLVADRGPEGHKLPPAYFPLACKWAFEQNAESGQLNTTQMLANGKCPSIVTEFLQRVQSVVWGRRLILSDGRRGSQQLLRLVPLEAEEGDLICIIYGCSVPVILRKCRKRKNAATPVSQESTLNKGRSSSLQDELEFSVPQMDTARVSGDGTNTSDSHRPSMTSAAGLTVPAERPNSAFSSHGVRKVLGEEMKERKTPKLIVSPDSQYQYSFIGECYIHGMMAGEGFKHQHEHRNPLKFFRLV